MTKENSIDAGIGSRLMSLDVFRGITMFLLIAEVTGIYDLLAASARRGTILQAIALQFQHHPWNGLRFWDVGLPFFMFVSGTAAYFSYRRRWEQGAGWRATLLHALKRSFLLFLLGWALYRITPVESNPHGAFLYDVLPQLAFASLVAFLIMKRTVAEQLGIAFGLLVLTELLYRFSAMPGFAAAFMPDHNFGSYIDLLLTKELSDGHWVAFNMVPATAFVIWGGLAGRLLKSRTSPANRIRTLGIFGICGVAAGLALSPVTPIIRRICTSSFVLVCGGLGLLALAFSYWVIDVLRIRRWAMFSVAVGMNPLFIYSFTQSGGGDWFRRIVEPFTMGVFGLAGDWPAQFMTGLATLGLLWALCYWLYKKNIFIRI